MENIFKKRMNELARFQKVLKRGQVSTQKDIPDHVFTNCEGCKAVIATTQLREHYYVCPQCQYHMRISAHERIRQLVDNGTFKEFDRFAKSKNEEQFDGYSEKLEKAQNSTGLNEAVVVGIAEIGQNKTVICVMDSFFMMGSMGAVVGEKITRGIEYATRKKLPIIISCTSGGARMQEGIMSLMQMSKTSAALKRHSDAGLLYITLLTHPTTGGVSASFAMLGDIIIAEPQALVGFAGKRVIEKTINEVLPSEFQTAEFVQEKGFIDLIVHRSEMRNMLARLLKMHGGKR